MSKPKRPNSRTYTTEKTPIGPTLAIGQNPMGQIHITRYVGTDDKPWWDRDPQVVVSVVGLTRGEARAVLGQLTRMLAE